MKRIRTLTGLVLLGLLLSGCAASNAPSALSPAPTGGVESLPPLPMPL